VCRSSCGIGYHSNHYKDKNPHAPVTHDWNFQIGKFLDAAAHALCQGGALYLFCRWDVYPIWHPYIKPSGLQLKTKIVWKKNNWSAGDLRGCFGNQYEEILFIVKGRHLLRGYRWSNIWEFDRIPPSKLLHPTQKPVGLVQRAIEASSDPDDTVLDPFAGSGTTGVAARRAGRGFILGDIDSTMVQIAKQRLGFPTDKEPEQPQPSTDFEYPDPADWGVHPEVLHSIEARIRTNVKRLKAE